jgi:3-deoxy-D-manno-octulosonic acid (KDO) 8-phosphate synthase
MVYENNLRYALCDAASQLSLEELEPMLERLLKIDAVVKGL